MIRDVICLGSGGHSRPVLDALNALIQAIPDIDFSVSKLVL